MGMGSLPACLTAAGFPMAGMPNAAAVVAGTGFPNGVGGAGFGIGGMQSAGGFPMAGMQGAAAAVAGTGFPHAVGGAGLSTSMQSAATAGHPNAAAGAAGFPMEGMPGAAAVAGGISSSATGTGFPYGVGAAGFSTGGMQSAATAGDPNAAAANALLAAMQQYVEGQGFKVLGAASNFAQFSSVGVAVQQAREGSGSSTVLLIWKGDPAVYKVVAPVLDANSGLPVNVFFSDDFVLSP